jgi:prefoldin alpha subunit
MIYPLSPSPRPVLPLFRPDLCTQTKPEAIAHYTTKTNFVQSNLETLQQTIERKQDNAQSVVQVLQMKLQAAQEQEQAKGQAA